MDFGEEHGCSCEVLGGANLSPVVGGSVSSGEHFFVLLRSAIDDSEVPGLLAGLVGMELMDRSESKVGQGSSGVYFNMSSR